MADPINADEMAAFRAIAANWTRSGAPVAGSRLLALCDETDRLRAEVDRLRLIEAWAQRAPHHWDCPARYPVRNPGLCACGRDEGDGL